MRLFVISVGFLMTFINMPDKFQQQPYWRTVCAIIVVIFSKESFCVPFIVQSLSSNYALVLGGYGPGYEELRKVEVVKHNKVCPNVIR